MFKQGRDGLQDRKNILGTFNYRSILSVNSDLNCVISNCITWIQYMVQENSSNASLGYNKRFKKMAVVPLPEKQISQINTREITTTTTINSLKPTFGTTWNYPSSVFQLWKRLTITTNPCRGLSFTFKVLGGVQYLVHVLRGVEIHSIPRQMGVHRRESSSPGCCSPQSMCIIAHEEQPIIIGKSAILCFFRNTQDLVNPAVVVVAHFQGVVVDCSTPSREVGSLGGVGRKHRQQRPFGKPRRRITSFQECCRRGRRRQLLNTFSYNNSSRFLLVAVACCETRDNRWQVSLVYNRLCRGQKRRRRRRTSESSLRSCCWYYHTWWPAAALLYCCFGYLRLQPCLLQLCSQRWKLASALVVTALHDLSVTFSFLLSPSLQRDTCCDLDWHAPLLTSSSFRFPSRRSLSLIPTTTIVIPSGVT